MALGTAWVVAHAALAVKSPVLNTFFLVFLPAPVFYCRAMFGRQKGAAVLVVCMAALFWMLRESSPGVGAFYVALPVLGFAMREFFLLGLPSARAAGLAGCAMLSVFAVLLTFQVLTGDMGYLALAEKHAADNLDGLIALLKTSGDLENTAESLEHARPLIVRGAARITPGIVVAWASFIAWANLLTALPLLRLKKIQGPEHLPLNTWSPPEHLVWAAICGLGLLLLPPFSLQLLGINLVIAIFPLYLFTGIAVLAYVTDKKRVPRTVRLLIFALLSIQPLLTVIVAAVGFFDLWADFRKIHTKAPAA